jgi:hypothetical protein
LGKPEESAKHQIEDQLRQINARIDLLGEQINAKDAQINALKLQINAIAEINAYYREELGLVWYILPRIGNATNHDLVR